MAGGGGGPYLPSMDLVAYRLGQFEKHAESADTRLTGIECVLNEVKLLLAGLPTQDPMRGWGLSLLAAIVGSVIALGALMLRASNNRLAAVQSGLSAVQTVAAANPPPAPAPTAKSASGH